MLGNRNHMAGADYLYSSIRVVQEESSGSSLHLVLSSSCFERQADKVKKRQLWEEISAGKSSQPLPKPLHRNKKMLYILGLYGF